MTHNEKVMALLSDREPHSHRELYGLYVMGHSRVADLRKRGHDIRCWREGDFYWYQLQDPVADETSTPLDTASATGNSGVAVGQGTVSSSAPRLMAGRLQGELERAAPDSFAETPSATTPSRGSATGNPSPRYNPGAFADGEHAHVEPLLGQLRLVRS